MILLPIVERFPVVLAVAFNEFVFCFIVVFAPDLLRSHLELQIFALLFMDLRMADRMDIDLHAVLFALLSVGGAVKDVVPLTMPRFYLSETDRADFGVAL